MLGMISNIGMLLGQETIDVGEPPAVPIYQQGWFTFLILIAVVAGLWWLGNKIARGLRMPDYNTRLKTILISVACAVLVIGNMWFENPDRPGPKLGVDLRGGVNIIGQLNLEDINDPDAPLGAQRVTAEEIIPNLLRRVDPSGTQDVLIRNLGDDKIEVIIPDVDLNEADEIWYRLSKTGHLQFRIAADDRFHRDILDLAEQMEKAGDTSRTIYTTDSDGNKKALAKWYNLAREDRQGPVGTNETLGIKYIPTSQQYFRDKKTGTILNRSDFNVTAEGDEGGRQFSQMLKKRGIDAVQILMIEPATERSDVQGRHLTGIRSTRDETGKPSVSFDLNTEGAKRMSYLTTMHKPRNEDRYHLGIVLDNALHSAPTIESPIHSSGRITGNFKKAEIDDLIINLRSGKIEVALNKNPISKQYIKSSLGAELRDKGIWAIGASFVLVLIFMVFYYRFAGFVAAAALMLNLVFILALIMAIRQPLTLTGLAGLVLTVGMSVDANVLIFERIREELAKGAALRMAIRNGFDKATVTIIDANVTTLITALVLYVIGTEQIKGFAVTLILGILMSMFTAIYCSRTVFDIAERKRWIDQLGMLQILKKREFNFLNKRFIAATLSVVLICCGIVGIYFLGAKILDHDLRGGSTAQAVFTQKMDRDEILSELNGLNLQHKGEDLEFSVAEITSNQEGYFIYKIDTNLPPYDVKNPDEVERWKELDQILKDTFGEKLRRHHVEIGGKETSSVDEKAKDELGMVRPNSWNIETSSLFSTVAVGPITMLQDEGNESEGQAESTEQAEPTQETQGDSTDGSAEIADQEGGQQETGSVDETTDSNAATTQDETDVKLPDDALPGIGTDSGAEVDKENKLVEAEVATFTLSFDNPITGKAIRTLLEQASERLSDQLELEASQIKVIPDKLDADTSALLTLTKDWTIELSVANRETAQTFLNSWSLEFNEKPYFPVAGGVGGQIAAQTQLQALAAVVASLLGIIAYVWIRFQNVAFGLAAVIALIHDVLIVLGAIALSHYVASALGFMLIEDFKISLPVVAALLTIIGYSLNDTIVVFDRIREVRGKRSEMTEEMIDSSISQTLSRTILTSLTTFIVVFILYCFGGDAIHGFAFALVIGVIVGTYSSIFIASPALLWLMNRGFSPDYDEDGNPIRKLA